MSSVPVVMAYGAAPDAPVYMTHAGMMERVRYLERWSRQHKNLCDDRHKWTVDRVKWMVDRVNYLTGKMELLSRNIDKYLEDQQRVVYLPTNILFIGLTLLYLALPLQLWITLGLEYTPAGPCVGCCWS